jgi:GNAT superfamily N-acetyltransferase
MRLEIGDLREEHLEDAAALVASRTRALRQEVPPLPARYEEVAAILPLLSKLARRAPGVAATRGGRLAGFLLGMALREFQGRRAAYSPEWANAAEEDASREIYRELYARLAPRWLANGCFVHVVTMLAHDRPGIDGWQWLSFGLMAVDAVRNLSPVPEPGVPVAIRRAGPADLDQVQALEEALARYLAGPPIFLAFTGAEGKESLKESLADPRHAWWLAHSGAEAMAYLLLGPASEDAATFIVDDKTASITGAFTCESLRGTGVGTALLSRGLDWARSAGYERCAVDFEPQNLLATRFWLRHFQPVCYSLMRCVDERLAWAHGQRQPNDLW